MTKMKMHLSARPQGSVYTSGRSEHPCLCRWPIFPHSLFFVFVQGFTYVLHEGECCGRCLPSACEVVTGSPRGDSQSYWQNVSLDPRWGRKEGSDYQPGSPFCGPALAPLSSVQ